MKKSRYSMLRPHLNVHDLVLVRYADFAGCRQMGIFYIIYTETCDAGSYRTERNFTCLKVSSTSQDKHSVKLTPDISNGLKHFSYLNSSKLMTFRVDQVVHKIGTVTGVQRASCIKGISKYLGSILKHLGVDLYADR